MGNSNSATTDRNSMHTERTRGSFTSDGRRSFNSNNNKPRHLKEHKRHGVVSVKLLSTNNNRSDSQVAHVVTPKGSIIFGSAINPALVQKSLQMVEYPLLPPSEMQLPDSRAHKLLVTFSRGWKIIPFPEPFSRHSGSCLILGDRNITSSPFKVTVGDCFRFGSVGLVVSEMKTELGEEQRLDVKTLEFLKEESLAFDCPNDVAPLAADEERDLNNQLNKIKSPSGKTDKDEGSVKENIEGSVDEDEDSLAAESLCKTMCSGGVGNGERYICYMCYETHDTPEDALVAPCECRGDTRYLHVQCLQKWYHASITGTQTQVIRTTGNGAPACKICGSAYKTTFRRPDGRVANLLEQNNNGPYLSLVVVTKHDTNPSLFNTKFRLNFGESARHPDMPPFLNDDDYNTITIGRSSSCNMILDYRTVSTIHAKITYSNGEFFLSDCRSSNGTMVYLQAPIALPFNGSMKLRMGRTTLSLQAKRNWSSALRSALGSHIPQHEIEAVPSAEDIQEYLGASEAIVSNFKDENSNQTAGSAGVLFTGGIGALTSSGSVAEGEHPDSSGIMPGHSYTVPTFSEFTSVEEGRDNSLNDHSNGGGPLSPDGTGRTVVQFRFNEESSANVRSDQDDPDRFTQRGTLLECDVMNELPTCDGGSIIEDRTIQETVEVVQELRRHSEGNSDFTTEELTPLSARKSRLVDTSGVSEPTTAHGVLVVNGSTNSDGVGVAGGGGGEESLVMPATGSAMSESAVTPKKDNSGRIVVDLSNGDTVRMQEESYLTSLPTAGQFTTYGQHRDRRSRPTSPLTPSNNNTEHEHKVSEDQSNCRNVEVSQTFTDNARSMDFSASLQSLENSPANTNIAQGNSVAETALSAKRAPDESLVDEKDSD